MNNYEWNKLRRSVIAKAWITEKLRISKGEGTRNWLVVQQDDILKYNSASGFVGQFLNDDTEEATMKVQFLDMCFEFLPAHDQRKSNRKTGLWDPSSCTLTSSGLLHVIPLSEPLYLGYFNSHRNLFVGQDLGFGLKVSASKNEDSPSMEKFGLKPERATASSDKKDYAQLRKEKYGF